MWYKVINPIRRLQVIISTAIAKRMARKAHRTSRVSSAILAVVASRPDNELWKDTSPHPEQAIRQLEASRSIRQNGISINFRAIALGDSLKDIPRNEFRTVLSPVNFAMSGSRTHHMLSMARAVKQALVETSQLQKVKFVYIGTLEGNGYIVGEPVEEGISRALSGLRELRELFPGVRIIVDSLPPTYSVFANIARIPYEVALSNWVQADRDAVLISFMRFGEWTPSIWLSDDGVHHTDLGTLRFDNAMKTAQDAKPGSIIFA